MVLLIGLIGLFIGSDQFSNNNSVLSSDYFL